MKLRIIVRMLAAMLVMAALGCKKSASEDSGAQDAAAEVAPLGRPGTAPAPVVQPSVQQPDTAPADIGEMQRQLMRWLMANKRRPADFEEFAATAGMAIPPPPAGKKYVITKDMHIVLVNR